MFVKDYLKELEGRMKEQDVVLGYDLGFIIKDPEHNVLYSIFKDKEYIAEGIDIEALRNSQYKEIQEGNLNIVIVLKMPYLEKNKTMQGALRNVFLTNNKAESIKFKTDNIIMPYMTYKCIYENGFEVDEKFNILNDNEEYEIEEVIINGRIYTND